MSDLYQTKEWESIPVRERYCLLPTMEDESNYNPLLDYTLHIPCDTSCDKSLRMADIIKKCLETYDPEAVEALKKFNRDSIERAAKKCITT